MKNLIGFGLAFFSLICFGLVCFFYLSCSHVNPHTYGTYVTANPYSTPKPEEKAETVVLPQMEIIEVKRDERILDFADRLEKTNMTTAAALSSQAALLPLSSYAFYTQKKHAPSEALLRLEGLFSPGYYELTLKPIPNSSDAYAAKLAEHNAHYILSFLLEIGSTRYRQLKLSNGLKPYEQIILASIVEKEAVANQDYSLVASVFLNRLKHQTNLASCPALEYALGYHRPFLTKTDILLNSPFNLYRKPGLPPAPICFFSDEALAAVTQPESSPYYFFVYDWVTSKLLFAREYRKHLENVSLVRQHYLQRYGLDEMYKISPGLYYEPVEKTNY